MQRILVTLVVASSLGGGAAAVASLSPTPGSEEPQTPVFSAGADLVTVDAVVLDRDGDPVPGLTAEDFTIEDEGVARSVSRFEAVTLPDSPADESPSLSFISRNTSAQGPSLRTFVVVFDDLHMSPTTANRARDAVWEFVQTLRDGDQISVVPTSGGAWWHVRIPEGRADLGGVLRRLSGQRPRRHAADRMSDYEAMRLHLYRDPQVADAVTRRYVDQGLMPDRPDPNAALMPRAPRQVRQEVLGYQFTHPMILARAAEVYDDQRTRKQATYRTLREVAEALELTRGRKSILFLSEGFIQEPGEPEYRDLVRASQRANAVVHFVDVRGLTGLPESADVEMGAPTGGLLTDSGDVLDQMNLPLQESLGAISVALDTGGEVMKNGNDLARGLKRLERESRTYYLLGFEPTGVAAGGPFRRLAVEVNRPGAEVLARRGYFPARSETDAPLDDGADPLIRKALDSPFDCSSIPLRLVSYVLGPAEGATRVLMVADVDPAQLVFAEKDGRFEDTLDLYLVVAQRDTGKRVQRGHAVELRLPPAAYDQMRRGTLPLMIDVPLSLGRHQARLLVRDGGSGLVGTVRHDLVVPPPSAFRVSTPILTDVVDPAPDRDSSLVRPRPLARRTFVSGERLTLLYQVHGARTPGGAPPRVVSGFTVESASGVVVATQPEGLLHPGPEGQVGRMAAISLDAVPAGVYAVVIEARDEASGEVATTRFPFKVAPPPGTAALEETATEEEGGDSLDRIRGYLIGQGRPAKGEER